MEGYSIFKKMCGLIGHFPLITKRCTALRLRYRTSLSYLLVIQITVYQVLSWALEIQICLEYPDSEAVPTLGLLNFSPISTTRSVQVELWECEHQLQLSMLELPGTCC